MVNQRSVHILSLVTDNYPTEENGCRKEFMTDLNERTLLDPGS